jgi:riboflavin transporter FmnP
MKFANRYQVRTDSKSIALLAIFSAMVIALEIFPIIGITDLKFYPEGIPFTIDWTGIPLVITFLGLGMVYSLIATIMMFIAIAYRNFSGAVFKGFAEFYTLLGLVAAKLLFKRYDLNKSKLIIVYTVFGLGFRTIGMYFANIVLLPILYPAFYTTESAIIASTVLIPWNIVQAIINIVGGGILYYIIPPSLALQAGLGDDADGASTRVQELPLDEILDSSTEESSSGS